MKDTYDFFFLVIKIRHKKEDNDESELSLFSIGNKNADYKVDAFDVDQVLVNPIVVFITIISWYLMVCEVLTKNAMYGIRVKLH